MDPLKRIDELKTKNQKLCMLTPWEQQYLTSLVSRIQKGRTITVRQNQILQKIETRLSDDNILAIKNWEEQWSAEKKEIANICAKYYMHENIWYRDVSKRILNEPEWIVPSTTYYKMCENKYAKGECVCLRATAKGKPGAVTTGQYHQLKNKLLFVIDTLDHAVNPANGAKIYLLLPAGGTQPITVEERWIKRFKKTKGKK